MAAKVVITERQQAALQAMAFSRSCPQGLAHRAEIILLAFEGFKNEAIAEKLGSSGTASARGGGAGRKPSRG